MKCPTCDGCGEVDDNYLDRDLVETVFGEYYQIRGWHTAYGVESWEDLNDYVLVRNDTSAMSCYSYEDVKIPKNLFVRDSEIRKERIQEDYRIFLEKESLENKDRKERLIRSLAREE